MADLSVYDWVGLGVCAFGIVGCYLHTRRPLPHAERFGAEQERLEQESHKP